MEELLRLGDAPGGEGGGLHGLDKAQRQKAYAADITYGTNNEMGFSPLARRSLNSAVLAVSWASVIAWYSGSMASILSTIGCATASGWGRSIGSWGLTWA
mgnify:CR=1 FL=1